MTSASEIVLVTGATGSIGPTLVGFLQQEGKQVRVLTRSPVPQGLFPRSAEIISGEITDQQAVMQAVAGVNRVFHLAAKLHIPNPPMQMLNEYERVNVKGTEVLVEAAQAAGVQRLVFFSTITVYGPTGRQVVDETAELRPDTIYAKTKSMAERVVLSARTRSGGEPLATVLRMAAVYGPRMKGNYSRLVKALASGRFVLVGDGSNLRTLVYVKDAVGASIMASEHPVAAGHIYNVSDGAIHSFKEIVSVICEALGRRTPCISIPVSTTRLAGTLMDGLLSIGGGAPRWVPAVDKLVESVAVRADRIQQELGFRPGYNLRDGWQEAIGGLAMNRDCR